MIGLVAALAMAAPPPSPPRPGEIAPMEFRRRISRTVSGHYLLYLPADYAKQPHERWPMLLFLHGSGESGDSLDDIRRHGPPKEIGNGRAFPFIIVCPQSPSSEDWDPYVLTGLLNEVEAKYRVDKDREYVTGLSMGGFGAYRLAALTPERFAAIVPISGGADPRLAAFLKTVPIWAIHGDHDPTVPIGEDQRIVDALKDVGADITFTIVPGGGHDVWTPYYSGTELYDWLLKHRRAPRK